MLQVTAHLSIVTQVITSIIDLLGLYYVKPKYTLLRNLLQLEVGVQVIELTFYVWMMKHLKIQNITPYRYYDWMITTPIMLIQLMAFMKYESYTDFASFAKENRKQISYVITLNWAMLAMGLLG